MIPFALTIFTGAFLLFQVQPLIGKYILPWFGGSPAVWTTCLLFFQVFLLGGYAYAHLSARWFKPRAQTVAHLILLAAALALLPIIPDAQWKPNDPANPTWRILALLTATIGLPYFVLSATSPLMQQWFTLINPGRSPYRLFALSNAGSLLALVSYPFLFEPMFSRKAQAMFWSWGLGLYAVLVATCAWRLWRTKPEVISGTEKSPFDPGVGEPPTLDAKLLWLSLPACASVLLLATTNKMCVDIAAIPFLWVLPLAIYLLSFIVCFENPRGYARKFYSVALVPGMFLLCLALFGTRMPLLLQIAIYSWFLFNCCMVCHGELYRLKPQPRYLTGFYLMIALGGALGGAFVALVAPVIFDDYLELHWGLALLALLLVVVHWREKNEFTVEGRRLPVWKAAAVGGIALSTILIVHVKETSRDKVTSARNFYGTLKVYELDKDNPITHAYALFCGTTMHGVQMVHPELARLPAGYYHERSGFGLALRLFPRQENRRIGVVGLGAGTIATLAHTGDVIRFYEINPMAKYFAEKQFSYLSNSTAQVEIVLGDGRLSLEHELPQQYDVLVLDAFSSDAIPVHLLTKEAFGVYQRHLKSDGVILANITNRHLDLVPLMDKMAAQFKMDSVSIAFYPVNAPPWMRPTHWYVLTRNKELINQAEIRAAASEPRLDRKRIALWTDDYASLYPLLK